MTNKENTKRKIGMALLGAAGLSTVFMIWLRQNDIYGTPLFGLMIFILKNPLVAALFVIALVVSGLALMYEKKK